MFGKMDSTGTVVWGGSYGGFDCGLCRLETTPDGGIVAIGNLYIGSNQYATLVVKTEQNGGIQWVRKIYDPSGASLSNAEEVIILSNGNCVVISTWSDGGGNWGHLISCFDLNNGNRLWHKMIYSYSGYYCTAIPADDGGFFILGYNFELARFDSGGALISSNIINMPNGMNILPTGIHITADQKFLVSGRFISVYYPTNDIAIAQMDTTGLIEWFRVYITDGNDYLMNVIEEDDGYTIAGSSVYTTYVDTAYIIRVNEAGDVRWAKKRNDRIFVHDGISAGQGKYLICGHGEPVNGCPALIMCADSTELFYGCYSDFVARDTSYTFTSSANNPVISIDNTILDIEAINFLYPLQSNVDCNAVRVAEVPESKQIKVIPNPTAGNITIQSLHDIKNGHVSIYNLIGDHVYDSTIEGNNNNIQTELSPGVYLLVVSDQANLFQSRLIIQ
jgi:hypothetical protein